MAKNNVLPILANGLISPYFVTYLFTQVQLWTSCSVTL